MIVKAWGAIKVEHKDHKDSSHLLDLEGETFLMDGIELPTSALQTILEQEMYVIVSIDPNNNLGDEANVVLDLDNEEKVVLDKVGDVINFFKTKSDIAFQAFIDLSLEGDLIMWEDIEFILKEHNFKSIGDMKYASPDKWKPKKLKKLIQEIGKHIINGIGTRHLDQDEQ